MNHLSLRTQTRILRIADIVFSRWVKDVTHTHRPNWAKRDTPMGWSDKEDTNSKGQQSFVGFSDTLKHVFSSNGDFSVASEEKISIVLGKVSKEMEDALKTSTNQKALYESSKHAMRIDFAIEAKNKSIFPYPVFVEVDGSQHEKNRIRTIQHKEDSEQYQSSENHLDRIKDFCARLNKQGVLIRVKSDKDSAQKTAFIYKKLADYYAKRSTDKETKNEDTNKRRAKIQEYADAMCFEYAKNGSTNSLDVGNNPDDYVKKVKNAIVKQALERHDARRGFSAQQVKLLNIWARDKKDLDGFVKALKITSIENFDDIEKQATRHYVYKGQKYEPYNFMQDIIMAYRSQKPKPH